MEAIAKLETFKRFDLPILVGASRKRFIDTVSPSLPLERIGGSLAAHLLAVRNGAAIIRTHDVAETIQAHPGGRGAASHQMTDQVFVSGLALHAYHGVMQHEAKVGQTFTLDSCSISI